MELKKRGVRSSCMAMDDYDFEKLENESTVYLVVATAGQGDLPENCHYFYKDLFDQNLPKDLL